MHLLLLLLFLVALSTAQTLSIPSRSGNIQSLGSRIRITGSKDYGNQEFDRGVACPSDPDDTGSNNAVFILENGASLSNVIIGARQIEGVHCLGACTLRNVWFRDICEGELRSRSCLRLVQSFADDDDLLRCDLRSRKRQRPDRRRRRHERPGQNRTA